MRRGWVATFGNITSMKTTIRQEKYQAAWRAGFSTASGVNYSLPIPFGRQRDAEACCAFLMKIMPQPESMTIEQFRDQFKAIAGSYQESVNYLVATCCQW